MSEQQELTLNRGGNGFSRSLGSGSFLVLAEHEPPGAMISPDMAGEKLAALDAAAAAASVELPMALAVTDRYSFKASHRACEYAGALPEERRNEHIFYLSGRGMDFREMRDLLSVCRNNNLRNVVPVSGDFVAGARCIEDVRVLDFMRREYAGEFNPGCVVNPFEYRADSQFSQLFKLIKKFNRGAQFAVAQAGWDMRKLQALKWYLSFRGMEYPLIARLILLTPEKLEKIQSGGCPGIAVSPDFAAILKRELSFSAKQFEAAQWRRLELQAAGCKLLGFSAVQIEGIDTPDRMRLAAMRLRSALREFSTFEQWVEEYNSYQARAEMAPRPDSFMLFDNLLSHRHYDPNCGFCRDASTLSSPGAGDRLLYRLCSALFGGERGARATGRGLLKLIFAGCVNCGRCRLAETEFVCVGRCPKQLSNGACGGVGPDGSCEADRSRRCVFLKQTHIAEWLGEPDVLEERYIPAADEE